MKYVLALAFAVLFSEGAFAQSAITVTVSGPIDGSQKTITKTYALTPQQFTGLMDLNRMDFCPKEPVNPSNPNGPAKSTITDAQVIGCFTDFLAIGTMQRITAHAREVARGDATGR